MRPGKGIPANATATADEMPTKESATTFVPRMQRRFACLRRRRRSLRGAAPKARATSPQRGRWAQTAWAGRSSRGVSRLVARPFHSGCPVAKSPFGAGLNPEGNAQRCAHG